VDVKMTVQWDNHIPSSCHPQGRTFPLQFAGEIKGQLTSSFFSPPFPLLCTDLSGGHMWIKEAGMDDSVFSGFFSPSDEITELSAKNCQTAC
jgi:hypothetical protein